MFEQDFLCTMNEATGLTNSDISSGTPFPAQTLVTIELRDAQHNTVRVLQFCCCTHRRVARHMGKHTYARAFKHHPSAIRTWL